MTKWIKIVSRSQTIPVVIVDLKATKIKIKEKLLSVSSHAMEQMTYYLDQKPSLSVLMIRIRRKVLTAMHDGVSTFSLLQLMISLA